MSPFSAQKEELERKISDLETTLHVLKQQLHKEIEAEQHDAIDHLEGYLEQVDHKYSNLKEFLEMVLIEIRALLHSESNKDRGH